MASAQDNPASAGRRLRDKSRISLNYMYAARGIEKDDSSDADFILEEENESDSREHLSFDESSAQQSVSL
ncbi:Glycoside-Pentoside-Hexuronide (GPH):Cation Symporter Family [Phytophthora cinnamomi]|uniref:Glycoside-Pentoside-Hexuronide (GPH):Cation Symporter Family n=1 Tax=Phytophthora cinnamomi TaxID=4785 RepID=UPI003559992D|nr:Glycoside-Pentoside-Hexuronide (GPH):Cation Symporter Family [Phytophthora cinnamomi]